MLKQVHLALNEIIKDSEIQRLFEKWKEALVHRFSRSPTTVLAYDSDLRHFLAFFQNYRGCPLTCDLLRSLKPTDWRAWLMSQKNDELTARTRTRRLSALKNFYRFLEQEGVVSDASVLSARPPKLSPKLPRPLFFEDIQNLLEACACLPGPPWVIQRDRALIFLLYSLGLRINEALNLNIEDIQEKDLTILGKRNKFRRVPFLAPIREQIAAYQAAYSLAHGGVLLTHGALFLGVRGGRLQATVFDRRMHDLRKMLHLPETATPHALRHSCASHLMAASENLRAIQELLGHASLSTTQVYTKLENDQLMEIYQRAHPAAGRASAQKSAKKEKET